jgi:hypothetical protein
VLWPPLLLAMAGHGPDQICPGSHADDLRRSFLRAAEHPEKTGADAMRIENENERPGRFGLVALASRPSLGLMDFLTPHSSRQNKGKHSRWSVQFRYRGSMHPSCINIKWTGYVANGVQLTNVHPELFADHD